MRQATTIASDLVAATKSTDTTPPTVTVTTNLGIDHRPRQSWSRSTALPPTPAAAWPASRSRWTAARHGIRQTGAAASPTQGVLYGSGTGAIQVRAIDDSANIQPNPAKIAVTSNCPCSLFGAMTPVNQDTADSTAVTLGTKFIPAADGFITGVRFYKGAGNTGTHTGTLYSASGSVLATGTFSNETATGWQMLNFPAAVPVTAGTTYVAAYYAPNGHYAADSRFFASHGFNSGHLSAPGGSGTPNGVFATGDRFPDQSFQGTQLLRGRRLQRLG